LFEGGSLPLGGGLDNLSVDGVFVVIINNVELDGGAGAFAVEHIVDAAVDVDDERNGGHDEI
jgi:hypothetical protein